MIVSTRLSSNELASALNHTVYLHLVWRAAKTLNHKIVPSPFLEDANAGSAGFILGFVDKHGTKIRRVTQITKLLSAYSLIFNA